MSDVVSRDAGVEEDSSGGMMMNDNKETNSRCPSLHKEARVMARVTCYNSCCVGFWYP